MDIKYTSSAKKKKAFRIFIVNYRTKIRNCKICIRVSKQEKNSVFTCCLLNLILCVTWFYKVSVKIWTSYPYAKKNQMILFYFAYAHLLWQNLNIFNSKDN